jgi:hypothetical protein
LAEKWGFLCRSAFADTEDSRLVHIANVQHVELGDIIHLYYSMHGNRQKIGSFVVADDKRYGAELVESTCLQKVTDPSLIVHLDSLNAQEPDDGEQYKPDPKLGVFTGWRIKKLPKRETPKFPETKNRNALIKFR